MWVEDLDNFLVVLDEIEMQEARDDEIELNDMLKNKGKIKNKVKKQTKKAAKKEP